MIKMFLAYLYEIPNSTTIDGSLVQIAEQIPAFVPMILLFVFFTVLLSGSIAQRNRIGRSDVSMWSVIASISTLMIASMMTLISGLILLPTLIIVVVITIFTGAWFLLTKNRYET